MDKIKQVLNSPLGRRKSRIFGAPLEVQISNQTKQRSTDDIGENGVSNVPFIVERICQYIFANGKVQLGASPFLSMNLQLHILFHSVV